MRKQKTIIYKEDASHCAACEYELWDKESKTLKRCGVRGTKWHAGNQSFYLCEEHAAFWVDAHDMRDTEYQAALLKKELIHG